MEFPFLPSKHAPPPSNRPTRPASPSRRRDERVVRGGRDRDRDRLPPPRRRDSPGRRDYRRPISPPRRRLPSPPRRSRRDSPRRRCSLIAVSERQRSNIVAGTDNAQQYQQLCLSSIHVLQTAQVTAELNFIGCSLLSCQHHIWAFHKVTSNAIERQNVVADLRQPGGQDCQALQETGTGIGTGTGTGTGIGGEVQVLKGGETLPLGGAADPLSG